MNILEKYELYKKEAKHGDLIFTVGKSLLSKTIRYFDKFPNEELIVNHVGIVTIWNNRRFVIESTASGINPNFLSILIKNNLDFVILQPLFNKERIEKAITELLNDSEKGIEYDKWLLLKIATSRKLGVKLKKQDATKDICSETGLLRYATKHLGALSFVDTINYQGWITPQDGLRYYDRNEFKLIYYK